MKKYGLQLRVQSNQKKQPTKPPLPNPLGFNDDDDDDDDNVERDILRQAYKNKTHKDVEELHKKALEEDPSAFDYDGVYEKMKEEQVRPIQQDRSGRQSRYIAAIKEKAKQREREHEVIYERKLAKERSKDEDLYKGKDKFVTNAYKKKLAEQEKWMEEERLREMREEKDDVTKKADISDFYFNLSKNVAFGADGANSRKPDKVPEEVVVQSPEKVSPPATSKSSESPRLVKRHQDEVAQSSSKENSEHTEKSDHADAKPISDASMPDQAADPPPSSDQPKPDHHKKSEDAVAAAKARFLARKKAKVQ